MRLRTILLAILVSLVAATILVLVSRKPTVVMQTAAPQIETVEVMVAKKLLQVGEVLTESGWQWIKWPKASVTPVTITKETLQNQPQIAKAIVRQKVLQGTPIKRSDLLVPGEGGVISSEVRPGMRAVTVPLAKIANGADYVVEGDYVDVMLPPFSDEQTLYTEGRYIELRGIRVIEVGHPAAAAGKTARREVSFLTFEVTPEQETMLAAGLRAGEVILSVRSFEDMYGNGQEIAQPGVKGGIVDQETAATGLPETQKPNIMVLDRDVVILRGSSKKSIYGDR